MHEPTRVLIVEARFYSDVAESLVEGSAQVLDAAGVSYDRLEVPGVFEVPAAIHNVAVSLSSSSETTKLP